MSSDSAVRLGTSDQEDQDRWYALLESREQDYQRLQKDDPSAPEIASLREAIAPMWQGIPPLMALWGDPRWAELEEIFRRGQSALRCFASLGPFHAGMPRRFGRLIGYTLGIADSFELLLCQARSNKDEVVSAFFSRMRGSRISDAAARSASLNGRLTGEVRNREAEATLIESYGVSPEAYRAQTKQIRRDLRELVSLVWRQVGSGQPAPTLTFFDRFVIPGIQEADAGSTLAVYQPFRRNRIAFSLPAINNLMSGATHILPTVPAGLSLEELIRWEPCEIGTPKSSFDLVDIAIHEATHALSRRTDEPLTPASPYWPAYEKFCREEGIALPATFTRIGMAQTGKNDTWEIGVGLGFFNEILTEAAAMEIRDQIDRQIPDSLKAVRQEAADSKEQPYRAGLSLLSEFLPGLSPLAVITGAGPTEQLLAGVRKRLSARGARKVLTLFFDGDELRRQLDQPQFAEKGTYLDLWEILRRIIAEDDAAKVERRRRRAKI